VRSGTPSWCSATDEVADAKATGDDLLETVRDPLDTFAPDDDR
jgi:hypothetical protein